MASFTRTFPFHCPCDWRSAMARKVVRGLFFASLCGLLVLRGCQSRVWIASLLQSQ